MKVNKTNFLIVFGLIAVIFYAVTKKPNLPKVERIILITIDTTRADHISSYGYPIKTTPFIDSLAKKGILFKRTLSHISTTVPSHANIFTSLYPHQVNVLSNFYRLQNGYKTIAEILKDLDFKTAGFVSTDQFIKNNFNQGFDTFEETKEPGGAPRTGDLTINEAINWLENEKDINKLFMWLHLYDPHRPYKPPVEFTNNILNQANESHLDYLINKQKINPDCFLFEDSKDILLKTISAYDGEILFDDTQIKRFYDYYNSKGLNENTLWIITSDHGEGLGNHKWPYHGKYIYNEQLLVPLILHFSSNSFKGTVIKNKLVSLVDIVPTIIELIGEDIKQYTEKYKFQGLSLTNLFAGNKNTFPDRYIPAQRKRYSKIRYPKIIDETTNYEWGDRFAIQNKKFKYTYFTNGNDEFFDLVKDPYETNNLIDKQIKEKEVFNKLVLTTFPIQELTNY